MCFLFQGCMFGFHVNSRGCIWITWNKPAKNSHETKIIPVALPVADCPPPPVKISSHHWDTVPRCSPLLRWSACKEFTLRVQDVEGMYQFGSRFYKLENIGTWHSSHPKWRVVDCTTLRFKQAELCKVVFSWLQLSEIPTGWSSTNLNGG